MTKRVLISLDELLNIADPNGLENWIDPEEWFDAQKDINTILADAKKDFLKHMECAKAQRRIFTGVHKDDN